MSELGRKSIKTDAVVENLERALQNGFTVTKATEIANIDRTLFYKWCDDDNAFKERMDRAQSFASEVARQNVVNAIVQKKDVPTSRWYLERKAKDEFATRQENVIETTEADRSAISEWARNLRKQLPPTDGDTKGN